MTMAAAEAVCEALGILVRAGIVDWNGHASARAPGGFVVNGADSRRARCRPGDLALLSLAGEALAGARPPNEAHLHAAVYRARPDVGAVVHGHPRWSGALSSAGQRLRPVTPQAALLGEVAIYPHAHSVSSRERAEAVAACLGGGRVLLLAGHGIVAAGADLVAAVAFALYAEEAAERQLRAAPLGGARDLSAEERDEYAQALDRPALFRKAWDHWREG
jgi:L-fuculose-phosphate aldolase